MRWMSCFSSQSVELRLVWTEQLSTEITSHFSCDALLQGKIICSREISKFVTKQLLFILISFWNLSTTWNPVGFHIIVNITFLLWICCLGFIATSSLDRVHIRRGDVSKKNHDSSSVTRWCQPSHSAACKNGNIFFAYSFHFRKNHCSTDAAPNVNGTIWIQWIRANTATLSITQ
jgi:hypothetical protein